jgi:hypothetical protein
MLQPPQRWAQTLGWHLRQPSPPSARSSFGDQTARRADASARLRSSASSFRRRLASRVRSRDFQTGVSDSRSTAAAATAAAAAASFAFVSLARVVSVGALMPAANRCKQISQLPHPQSPASAFGWCASPPRSTYNQSHDTVCENDPFLR